MYNQFDDDFEEQEFDECDYPEREYTDPFLYDDLNDPAYYPDPSEDDIAVDTAGDQEELQEIAESSKLMFELGKGVPDEIADDKDAVAEYMKNRTTRYANIVREMLTRAKDMSEAVQCIQKSLPTRTKLRTSMTKLVDALADALDDFEVATDEKGVVSQFAGLNDIIRNTSLLLSGFMEIKQLGDEDEKHEVAPINLQRIAEFVNRTRTTLKEAANIMSTPTTVRAIKNEYSYTSVQPSWSVRVTKAVDDVVQSIVDVSNMKTAKRAIAKIVSGLNESMVPGEKGEMVLVDVQNAIELSERIIPTGLVCSTDTVSTELISRSSTIGLEPKKQNIVLAKEQRRQDGRITRKQINATVMFTCTDSNGVKIGGKISQYVSLVNDAVCTLYEDGNADHTMTTDMILETMSGKKLSSSVSPAQSEQINDAMQQLAGTRGYVDYTEWAQITKKKDAEGNQIYSLKHDGALLSYECVTMESGPDKDSAKMSRCYRIKEEPLLLRNANLTGQKKTIPRTWYNIREIGDDGQLQDVSIPYTKDRMSVTHYILKNVKMMQYKVEKDRRHKHPKGIPGGRLSYSKIFHECEFDVVSGGRTKPMSRSNLSNMKDYIKIVFGNLKAIGVIESWTEYPDGKRKDGISYIIK